MKTDETVDLLREIRDGATGTKTSLGEILRLCMRLGKKLGNEELVTWARKEASGYDTEDTLPDYRILACEVRGTFFGPFGSGIKNAHIPKGAIDKKHREGLFNSYMYEPVSQLESYSSNNSDDSNMLQNPWPADIIAYYSHKEIYTNGQVLGEAHRILTKQSFTGILETIRTRVLDFILEIEDGMDIDIDAKDQLQDLQEIPQQLVQNTFINTIHGGHVALSNNGDAGLKAISIHAGNLVQLSEYLSSIGVESKEITKLERSIKEDGNVKEKFGPKVGGWLSNMSIKALKGGLNVGKEIGTALLTQALMKYYGLDK